MLVQGFYGKLPSHGDFLRRGLTDGFVAAWDAWLQRVLAATVGSGGSESREAFRKAPMWRFVLSPGLVDEAVWTGVLVPSEDRVGRAFGFCAAIGYPETTSPFRLAAFARDWLDAGGEIATHAAAGQERDLDALASRLAAVVATDAPPPEQVARSGSGSRPGRIDGRDWRFPLPADAALHLGMIEALERLARERFEPLSLWWSEGGGRVAAQWRCAPGWPDAQAFGQMMGLEEIDDPLGATRPMLRPETLDAAALPQTPGAEGWLPVAPPVAGASSLPETPTAARVRSAAWTTAGKLREENEDAYVARPEAGLWAVADGLGGHAHGEVASRMVVEALEGLELAQELADAARQLSAALEEANRVLQARRVETGIDALTTVVSLVVRGERGAVMWVGDSRLYRLRRGRLECLTRDHAWSAERTGAGPGTLTEILAASSGELSRAVGAEETVELDTVYLTFEAGDRVLLCSDGVYSEVAVPGLVGALSEASAETAIRRLEALVEASQARDNATAIVVAID